MLSLDPEQIRQLADHVSASGLSGPLAEELTDHLCCLAEDGLTAGLFPQKAMAAALASLPAANLSGIRRRVYFTTKIRPMLAKIIPFAAILSGALLLTPAGSPPVSVTPCTAEVEEYFPPAPDFDPPTGSPIAGINMHRELSAGFGMRVHPFTKARVLHRGIDLKASTGTAVIATAEGTVLFADEKGANGLMVRIRHNDGYVTVYKHLSEYIVRAGDTVSLGQQIGMVGSTGASTAPHLHYEVLKDDQPVDPLALLD